LSSAKAAKAAMALGCAGGGASARTGEKAKRAQSDSGSIMARIFMIDRFFSML
jgi:hypothetical protein